MRERGVGDGLGRLHARDLLHVFHGAQVHDEVRRFSCSFGRSGTSAKAASRARKPASDMESLDAERDGFGLDRQPVGIMGGEGFGDELRVATVRRRPRPHLRGKPPRALPRCSAKLSLQHGIAQRNQQRVRPRRRNTPSDAVSQAMFEVSRNEERAHARIGAGGAGD